MKFLFLLSLFLLSAFNPVFSQDRSFQRYWLGIINKKELVPNTFFWTEFQSRYDLNESSMQQTLIRFGPLYRVDKNHELGFLMGYVQSDLSKEYRPTLQYVFSNELISLRNRLESRFFEDDPHFSARWRSMLRYQTAVTGNISAVVWEEPFLNLITDDGRTGNRFLERNRFFIGPRFTYTTFSFEVGYMNQYIPRKGKTVIEHTALLFLFL